MSPPTTPSTAWTIVVPVKGTVDGKSRLMPERSATERARLAEAFALDTLAALQRAASVGRVIVVTDAAAPIAARLRERGLTVVADPGQGLNAAVTAGLAEAGEAPGLAALLGDLPGLRPADVDVALSAARAHPLAFVADANGTGTTLITATTSPLVPRFGAGSAERHRAAGHVLLALGDDSSLRHDVDTEVELQAALERGVGEHTGAALRAIGEATRAESPAPSALQQ
ncbi:2-phospho-L-lactate guanylyltransferase [Herbiconiux sp. P18]|uniref:2-phospho-L-lactate guanylyltransferase n=1 Tax=Herbiconiux liangxiaofengii TaxID=3342795 RepID=UPI0035BA21CA